jgi:hypothetical protein
LHFNDKNHNLPHTQTQNANLKMPDMKKSILLLSSILILLAASCGDDDETLATDQLPPATMIGANTFGCKVNGDVWIPHVEGAPFWESPIYAKHDRWWPDCDQLFVSGERRYEKKADIYQSMSINVWCPVLGENEITFSKGRYRDLEGCGEYYLDTLSPRILIITRLDSVKFIASGTFEFTVINDDCEDTLRITEGRFDVDTHL